MIHFSVDLDDEFFNQLTAEKMVTRYRKGFPVIEFVKTRERNEALDCVAYAYAALDNLNVNMVALDGKRKKKASPDPIEREELSPLARTEPPRKRADRTRSRRKGGFATRY